MSESGKTKTPEGTVVAHALRVRDSDRGAAARMRRGLNPLSEYWAYGDVIPHVEDQSVTPAMLKTAAIIASHPKIAQCGSGKRPRLGASFRQFSIALATRRGDINAVSHPDPNNPDSVARRLEQLPELDLDEAAQTINRILSVGDDLGVPIDYYQLANVLARWGDGISEGSTQVRRSLLRDYYSYRPSKSDDETPTNKTDEEDK